MHSDGYSGSEQYNYLFIWKMFEVLSPFDLVNIWLREIIRGTRRNIGLDYLGRSGWDKGLSIDWKMNLNFRLAIQLVSIFIITHVRA